MIKLKHFSTHIVDNDGTSPGIPSDWNGSQAPCFFDKGNGEIVIGYTMRDKDGYSRPVKATLSAELFLSNIGQEVEIERIPTPELKGPYKHGLILSQIIDEDNMIFSGWENKDGVESRWKVTPTLIKNGVTITFVYPSPSNGQSMPFVDEGNEYYMHFHNWVELGGRLEPYYSIYEYSSELSESYELLKADKCYCRPVIFNGPKGKELWYCHRNLSGYKDNSKDAYKLGIMRMINNQWTPVNHEIDITFDTFQVAYPYPFSLGGRNFCLFNGDKSMRGDIIVAEVFYN